MLLQSRLNTSEAVARLEAETPMPPEVAEIVRFIKTAQRGVILRRATRRHLAEE